MFRIFILSFAIIFELSMMSCAGSGINIKVYENPNINQGFIQSIAILPINNINFTSNESMKIKNQMILAFKKKNSEIKIIGSDESVEAINKASLTDKYNNLRQSYLSAGILNIEDIKEIGISLKVNAILLGTVFNLKQIDGINFASKGQTSLTLMYSLISTIDGSTLWAARSSAFQYTGTTYDPAPQIYVVFNLAQKKIFDSLPVLK
jgi:hypothetical protein